MTTWKDFIALFDGLTNELEKLNKTLEEMKVEYEHQSQRYKEIIKWADGFVNDASVK